MATPEIKAEDILLGPVNRVRDNAQVFATDEVVKGMNIAPLLGFQATEDKNVSWFTRAKTSKEQFDQNLIFKPVPSEKAELLRVSGMELKPNRERVVTVGYQYAVDLNDLEESPQSYLMDMQDLFYGIADALETDASTALINNAPACNYTPKDGAWNTSTAVAKDLRGYRSEYAKRDIKGMLREIFLHSDNYDELGDYILDALGVAGLNEEEDIIKFLGFNNRRTAIGVPEGSILGFDSQIPPGYIHYRTIPGAYKPVTVKEGTAGYLPVINMKVEDDESNRMEPVRIFKFSASWVTAITRPAGIIYDTGI